MAQEIRRDLLFEAIFGKPEEVIAAERAAEGRRKALTRAGSIKEALETGQSLSPEVLGRPSVRRPGAFEEALILGRPDPAAVRPTEQDLFQTLVEAGVKPKEATTISGESAQAGRTRAAMDVVGSALSGRSDIPTAGMLQILTHPDVPIAVKQELTEERFRPLEERSNQAASITRATESQKFIELSVFNQEGEEKKIRVTQGLAANPARLRAHLNKNFPGFTTTEPSLVTSSKTVQMPDGTFKTHDVSTPRGARDFRRDIARGAVERPLTGDIGLFKSPKTAGTVEEKIIALTDQAERLRGIAEAYQEDFTKIFTGLRVKGSAVAEKLGIDIGEERRLELSEFTTLARRTLENINFFINELSGAQVSEAEAVRLRGQLPDLGGVFTGDSATEFQTKLSDVIMGVEAAIERYRQLNLEGLVDQDTGKLKEGATQLFPLFMAGAPNDLNPAFAPRPKVDLSTMGGEEFEEFFRSVDINKLTKDEKVKLRDELNRRQGLTNE